MKTQTLQTDQKAKTSDTIRSGSLAFRCGVIVHSIMRYMQMLVGLAYGTVTASAVIACSAEEDECMCLKPICELSAGLYEELACYSS